MQKVPDPPVLQRQQLEHAVSELFDRVELRALLSGDSVSLNNSPGGGSFATTVDGQRPTVDATYELSNHA